MFVEGEGGVCGYIHMYLKRYNMYNYFDTFIIVDCKSITKFRILYKNLGHRVSK